MIDPEEIQESEVDQLIDEIASEVVRRRLETPAVLFLEMNRPLSFIGSQGMILATPLLGPIFGPEKIARYSKLLSKGENVEKLVSRIEEMSEKREKS